MTTLYKITKFTLFITLISCLKVSPPDAGAPENSNPKNPSQNVFKKAIQSVRVIDARSMYTIQLKQIKGSLDKITFTFKGKQMPTLTLHKHEIVEGKTLSLISPSYKLDQLIIEASKKNKIVSEQIIKLKKSTPNIIKI